jgi:hypothetical protein
MDGKTVFAGFTGTHGACPAAVTSTPSILRRAREVFANSPPVFPTSRACSNPKLALRKNKLCKMARRTIDVPWEAIGVASKRMLQLFRQCRIAFD